MYGLFNYDYDYYEWETLVCVSKKQKLLIDYYIEMKVNDKIVWSEQEHSEAQDTKTTHFMIKLVEELV